MVVREYYICILHRPSNSPEYTRRRGSGSVDSAAMILWITDSRAP